MSTGTGIALAGLWLACAATSMCFAMISFVWSDYSINEILPRESGGIITALAIIAAPLLVSASLTGWILSQEWWDAEKKEGS